MKEKWTPPIIVVITLIVFVILGQSCASKPKDFYLNEQIPKEHLAGVLISTGTYFVKSINDVPVDLPKMSHLIVYVPSGETTIKFNRAEKKATGIGGLDVDENEIVSEILEATHMYRLGITVMNPRTFGIIHQPDCNACK